MSSSGTSRDSAGQAAVWLARGGALVTLLHRRADLRETMSDYLIHELDRYGVAVRDSSEIGALHGENGQLEAVTLKSGEQLPVAAERIAEGRKHGPAVGLDRAAERFIPGCLAEAARSANERIQQAIRMFVLQITLQFRHRIPITLRIIYLAQ